MKTSIALIFGIIMLATPVDLEARLTPPDTLHLFNGKDLSGWYTFIQERGKENDPKGVFKIVSGLLSISGEEWGCVTTYREYENYHLFVEYRWGKSTYEPRLDKARDSGILLHSKGEDGGSQGIWMHSIECQVIEGGTGDIIVVGDGSDRYMVTCTVSSDSTKEWYYDPEGTPKSFNRGRINWHGRDPEWEDRLGFRGRNDLEKPVGQWNKLECIARQDSLIFILNGHVVNRASSVQPSTGKIQIQSEGAEILVRRIDLIPL